MVRDLPGGVKRDVQEFPPNGLDKVREVCACGPIEPKGCETGPLLCFSERLQGSLL
jgi:hypothetical protein